MTRLRFVLYWTTLSRCDDSLEARPLLDDPQWPLDDSHEVLLEDAPLVEGASLALSEVGVLGRPVVGGREEELLPVVHPQLGKADLVLLHDFLPVAVELVRKGLERVRHA